VTDTSTPPSYVKALRSADRRGNTTTGVGSRFALARPSPRSRHCGHSRAIGRPILPKAGTQMHERSMRSCLGRWACQLRH
jgi:hypothetical protein